MIDTVGIFIVNDAGLSGSSQVVRNFDVIFSDEVNNRVDELNCKRLSEHPQCVILIELGV